MTESLLCIIFITYEMKKRLLFKILIWEDVHQKLLSLILTHPFELLVLIYHLFGKPPIVQRKGELADQVFTPLKKVALADFLRPEPGEWTLKLEKFPLSFNRPGLLYFPHNLFSDVNIHESFSTQPVLLVPI